MLYDSCRALTQLIVRAEKQQQEGQGRRRLEEQHEGTQPGLGREGPQGSQKLHESRGQKEAEA